MYNEKKFRGIYDEFLASGLTIRDYCANQQMNEAKFYYWQNKLKGLLPPKSGFIPMVFENGGQAQSSRVPAPVQTQSTTFSTSGARPQTISCEISYPNGVITDFKFIENRQEWTGIQSVVKVDSIREFKNSDKPTENFTRYYISSLLSGAKDLQRAIRLHWGIENKQHWVLDVAFSEDASRKRVGNAAQNFSILSKIALNLLKKDTTTKQGIKGKRLKAAYDHDYLIKIQDIKV